MIKKLSQLLVLKQVSRKSYVLKQGKLIAISLVVALLLVSFPLHAQRDYFDGVTGDIWGDTHGNHIQAHGGQVQKIGNKWWWIGENRSDDRSIMLYSSPDLYNWTPEGDNGKVMRVLPNRNTLDTDPYFTALYGHLSPTEKDLIYDGIYQRKVIERPKLIHNQTTGKYIIWFHADDSNYGAAAAGVAISDNISGPYTYIKRTRLHQLPDDYYGSNWYESTDRRGMSRDMTLFKDDDGTAYIIYSSEENMTMFISRLNDDYTDLDVPQTPIGLAQEGIDFVRLFPGAQREAPAMFKYNNKYYMITSGASGWDPNQARYWMADDILGEWTNMGDPCINEPDLPYAANKTFSTQSTCVIPVDAANGKFIYMGDRWKSSNLKDSRYVWLPIFFKENGGIELRSMGEWNLGFFDLKYDDSQFEYSYYNVDELPATLQSQVWVGEQWENQSLDIAWEEINIKTLPPGCPTLINGVVSFNGTTQTVKARLTYIPDGLLYFIDNGAKEGSFLHEDITSKGLAPNLINTTAYDQPFVENSWGYTGTLGVDISRRNEEDKDPFVSGWWAHASKTIDYKLKVENGEYYLAVGFQEWWNTGRNMRISLIYENAQGQDSVVKILGNFYNNSESTQTHIFTLDDLSTTNPYITVSVEKTGSPDPLMSWISLTSMENSDVEELELALSLNRNINNKNARYTEASFAVFEEAFTEAMEVSQAATSPTESTVKENLLNARAALITDFSNDAVVKIEAIPDQHYTGEEIKPPLTITDGGNPAYNGVFLEEGVHYTITSYAYNVEINSPTTIIRLPRITITGMGIYEGVQEITFNIIEPTGILPIKENNNIMIYPNPVSQNQPVYIEFDKASIWGENVSANIYDIAGRLVKQQKITENHTLVELSVPSGIYIVKIKDKTVKLIVK